MRTVLLLVLALSGLTPGRALAQQDVDELSRARGVEGQGASEVITNLELGETTAQLRALTPVFFGDQSRGVPSLKDRAGETERGLQSLLSGDPAGRWVGTVDGALLSWIAFPKVPRFQHSDMVDLESQILQAERILEDLSGIEEPARFGHERMRNYKLVQAVLLTGEQAKEEVLKRTSFLAHWRSEFQTLPSEVQEEYFGENAPPPLGEQITARLGRLLADALQLEQAESERVARESAERTGQARAEAEEQAAQVRLQHERRLLELSRSLLDAEFRVSKESERRRIEEAEQLIEQLRAERERRRVEVELELRESREEIRALRERVRIAEVGREIEELPPEILGRLKALTAPGFFKPESAGGAGYSRVARYSSLEPVPHSYSALAAFGALDPDPHGLWRLYIVLSAPEDQLRPRWAAAGWGYRTNRYDPRHIPRLLQDNPNAYRRLAAIQACLREHGSALVKLGYLSE